MKTQFGNILLRRRKELGFTQEYIAKALQAISKWERGETMPDILLLPALADLLQTSTDELLPAAETAVAATPGPGYGMRRGKGRRVSGAVRVRRCRL